MKNNEIWKTIDGYEDYQVSSYGRVKSLKNGKEKILSPGISNDNYLLLSLYKNKIRKQFLVHRLVAIAFIPNPHNYPQVNHKDENPSNNCVENLEFCDAKYNNNYGNHCKRISESKSKKLDQFDLEGNFIKTWSGLRQVERELGIFHISISKCCTGKQKTAGHYIWKYHNNI